MIEMSVAGMERNAEKKATRAQALSQLTEKAFDPGNKIQMDALEEYVRTFESVRNQMYLYQFINRVLVFQPVGALLASAFSLPNVSYYLMSSYFLFQTVSYVLDFLGWASIILDNFNINDFHVRLDEMKTLYRWCLRDEKNLDCLKNQTIQQMIKVMAPLCTIECMRIWPETAHIPTEAPVEASASWWDFGIFNRKKEVDKKEVDEKAVQVEKLKLAVETRAFDLSIVSGAKVAVRYFLEQTRVNALVERLPQVAQNAFSPSPG